LHQTREALNTALVVEERLENDFVQIGLLRLELPAVKGQLGLALDRPQPATGVSQTPSRQVLSETVGRSSRPQR
jgi:hypothetical protein